MSFKPARGAEGVLFSLTNPASKQDYLSLNLGRGEDSGLALQLVQSSVNGTRVVPLPAAVREGTWSQLALSIQGRSSVKTFLNCVWAGTQIIDGRSLAVPTNPDLVVGYLVQTELEQLTVTRDPGDVGEQCSNTRQPLQPVQVAPRELKKVSAVAADGRRADAKEEDEEGSGDVFEGSAEDEPEEFGSASYPLEWSSWSPCSASCGAASQSRWSRCADSAEMMECIQAGLEKKMTRSCRLDPCSTNSYLEEEDPVKKVKVKEERHRNSKEPHLGERRKGGGCMCAPESKGTCRPGSPVCECNKGWGGDQCIQPLCNPPCRNGANCVRPDVCACEPGYTGTTCQTAFCHPECLNGGKCSKPFVCQCPKGTTGDNCQIVVCDPPCEHGGVCSSPGGTCTCPPGHRGPTCAETTCKRDCQNGGTCLPNSFKCSCQPGFYGQDCSKRSCGEYAKVKEPRRTGYRRIVSLGGPNGSQPVYKVYYRTVYRTVTRCKEDLT